MKLKKGLSLLMALVLLAGSLGYVPEVQAAGKTVSNTKAAVLDTVYVSTFTDVYGDGSKADRPLKNMQEAFDKVADNGRIVIVEGFTSRLPLQSPAGKSITIEGQDEYTSWNMGDYLLLRGNVTINSLNLEAITTDYLNRCIYVNGYSFTMTKTSRSYANDMGNGENYIQKASIFAGSYDGSVVEGRKAMIRIEGDCRLQEVHGYGAGGAKVNQGASVYIGGESKADVVDGDTGTEVTLQTNKKYRGSVSNIGLLRINSLTELYQLPGVKDVELNSSLSLTSADTVRINGKLQISDGALLDLSGNFHAAGEITGSVRLIANKGCEISSGVITSDVRFTFDTPKLNGCEPVVTYENNIKTWTIKEYDTADIYYLNGASGDDSKDGRSENNAFKSFDKLNGLPLAEKKDTLRIMVTGDTVIPDRAELKGKSYQFIGTGKKGCKLTFEKGVSLDCNVNFENIRLSFTETNDYDEIEQTGGLLSMEGSVSIEGNAPDIKNTAGSIELRSGTYGSVSTENKENSYIFLVNAVLKGKLLGWGQVDCEALDYPLVFEGDMDEIGLLNFTGATSKLKIYGNAVIDWISTDNYSSIPIAPQIAIASGKCITLGSVDPQHLAVTVLPGKDGQIAEGCYIQSNEQHGNIFRTGGMKGYCFKERTEEDTYKYKYYLEKGEVLSNPPNVKWSDSSFGRLTWDAVPGASGYLCEVYVDGVFHASVEVKTNEYDFKDIIKHADGQVEVRIAAFDSTGQYGDSEEVKSSPITYIPISSIQMANEELEAVQASEQQLKVLIAPLYANDKELIWSSSDSSVVQVDQKSGIIKALKPGVAVITAKTTTLPSLKAQCKVTVVPPEVQKEYTIHYNMEADAAHNNPVKFGDQPTILKDAQRKGYFFKGWYRDAGYKTRITKLPAIGDVTENYELYPKWESASLKTPKVTRLSITNGQMSINWQSVSGAERYEINYSDNKSFANSKTTVAGGTGKVITGLAKGKNYYARVRAGRKDSTGNYIYSGYSGERIYQIKYVLNGGTNSSSNPTAYLNTKVSLKNPTRSGYLFLGWYTNSSYKTKVTTLTKNDYTLYAKWAKVSLKKSAITAIKNPISGSMAVSYAKISGAKGYQIVYSTNKKFTKSATKSVMTSGSSKTLTKLKSNTSYYVKVRAYAYDSKGARIYGAYSSSLVGYSIKYVLNGGRNSSANIIRYYNTSVSLKNPTRKGYVFKGWYTSRKYKTRVKSIKKGKRTNYTLYAKWARRR